MRVLVTGGAGFMGSDFIRYLVVTYPDVFVLNYDKLTYCGNLTNLASISDSAQYSFVRGDIADRTAVRNAISGFKPDVIVNFAAETHVDRSILDPGAFVQTDILGTYTLLEAVREFSIERYIQISTDEVYGPIPEGETDEHAPFRPASPYAASKAGADHLVSAYNSTYGTPVIVTHAANNYGPHQYPEKLIPLFITNLLEGKRVPLYGSGLNIREWLYVRDHSRAIDHLMRKGEIGESYNIGSGVRKTNIEITELLLSLLGKDANSIERVEDRLGHDLRYALDAGKIRALGWTPEYKFEDAIKQTVAWYTDNRAWWEPLKSGAYLEYYRKQYETRRTGGGLV